MDVQASTTTHRSGDMDVQLPVIEDDIGFPDVVAGNTQHRQVVVVSRIPLELLIRPVLWKDRQKENVIIY